MFVVIMIKMDLLVITFTNSTETNNGQLLSATLKKKQHHLIEILWRTHSSMTLEAYKPR